MLSLYVQIFVVIELFKFELYQFTLPCIQVYTTKPKVELSLLFKLAVHSFLYNSFHKKPWNMPPVHEVFLYLINQLTIGNS